jgi:nitroreductase
MELKFLELAKRRFSSRQYSPQPVEREKLLQVLEAARLAPSAVNYQPWVFLVLDQQTELDQIRQCYPRDWFAEVPLVIVCCCDHRQSWKRKRDGKDHGDIDMAIAIDHMTLAAAGLGLGTCWVCNFDAQAAAHALQLPPEVEPVVLLPIGYSQDASYPDRHREARKPLEEIVRWGAWE